MRLPFMLKLFKPETQHMNDTAAWRAPFPKFPENQLALSLEILLAASAGLRKQHPNELEDRVTQRLRLRIRKETLFRKSHLELFSQFEVYDPYDEEEELRGRLDLSFHLANTQKPAPYFAIEAKRLRFLSPCGSFSTGNSEYVTHHQGMRCFIEDRYAEGLDSGAMLGSVYDGAIDSAKDGISQLIEKHAKLLKCKQPHRLIASKLPSSGSGVDETIHTLNGRDFRIFHIFLAV